MTAPRIAARRAAALLCPTATLFAVIACTSTRPVACVGSLRAAPPAIEVRNDRFDDVVVYVIRSGMPFELGVVPAVSRRVFTPSETELGAGAELSFGAGRRGAAMDQVTQPLHFLSPGRIASWTVGTGSRVEQPIVR